jgi:hypothetical protein
MENKKQIPTLYEYAGAFESSKKIYTKITV